MQVTCRREATWTPESNEETKGAREDPKKGSSFGVIEREMGTRNAKCSNLQNVTICMFTACAYVRGYVCVCTCVTLDLEAIHNSPSM